nr:MAG TPA: hypothetical protein [Caudoviricetes sp.]
MCEEFWKQSIKTLLSTMLATLYATPKGESMYNEKSAPKTKAHPHHKAGYAGKGVSVVSAQEVFGVIPKPCIGINAVGPAADLLAHIVRQPVKIPLRVGIFFKHGIHVFVLGFHDYHLRGQNAQNHVISFSEVYYETTQTERIRSVNAAKGLRWRPVGGISGRMFAGMHADTEYLF